MKLAISTISKAENYFSQALEKVKAAKGQGMEIAEIVNQLINSSKKHQEILQSLVEKSPDNFKSAFNLQLKRVSEFTGEANAFVLK